MDKIYYGSDERGKEIDFLVKNGDVFDKYQVTTTLNEENKERELHNFLLVQKYLPEGKNVLLSLDDEEGEIEYKELKISRKNIIKFLLDGFK